MEQTYVVVQSSMLQVLGTRFRAGFVYNMGDEEASKDAGQQATAVHTVQGPLITDGRNSNEMLFLSMGLW